MNSCVIRCLCYLTLLLAAGCSDTNVQTGPVGSNAALFYLDTANPANSIMPLPNILTTMTAADPLAGRAANKPMDPLESLAYINRYEVGGSNAVSGLNAPIYLRFTSPLDPSTVTGANIKVF